jgi:hypothetical protein
MEKTVAHFVWLNPGERLFIITDAVGRNHDYTHAVEIVVPNNGDPDFMMYDPAFPVTTGEGFAWDANAIANMTCATNPDGSDKSIDQAVAEEISERLNLVPYVVTPLKMPVKLSDKPQTEAEYVSMMRKEFGAEEIDKPTMDAFGAEEAND